jgi:mitogen-activated protein kinase kinase
MDGGSLDKLVPTGVGIRDEKILAWVTSCTVRGLKYLKDNLNIIHRGAPHPHIFPHHTLVTFILIMIDVKPTNILVNTKGDVKLCDFGVSGNLVASLAKTNIGCQSYMAPERIRGDNAGSIITYSVQSDIWSLGLSILEIAKGVYPYPPETYNSVFAQLSAIVDGEPPTLPEEFSRVAQLFVQQWYSPFPTPFACVGCVWVILEF